MGVLDTDMSSVWTETSNILHCVPRETNQLISHLVTKTDAGHHQTLIVSRSTCPCNVFLLEDIPS